MGRYRLIGGVSRRFSISWEDKVKAIQAVCKRGLSPEEALGPVYEKARRPLPKNTSVTLGNWRKAVQRKLDEENSDIIELCKAHGVVEEDSVSPRRTRRS